MIKRKIRKWVKEKKLNDLDTFYFNMFVQKIQNGINFSLSRFGDGEWSAILDIDGENCDGHTYFKDMGLALRAIFDQPKSYYLGIQPLSMRTMAADIMPYTQAYNQRLFNSDIFHIASEFGLLHPLIEALNTRDTIMVGPQHLDKIQIISPVHHIVIPDSNCWTDKDNTLNALRTELNKTENLVVLFSASMAANVYIDILQSEYGDRHTLLDFGSLWEPYAGNFNRSYHRRIKL